MIYVLALVILVLLLLFSRNIYRVGIKTYLKRILVSIDQFANVLFFAGYEDEQMSSAAYRLARDDKYWYSAIPMIVINFLFFWERGHCRNSYMYELDRLDFHISMRVDDGRDPAV